MPRLFVAIDLRPLDFEAENVFSPVRKVLLEQNIEHRWIPSQNLHLTLNFLGEVESSIIPEIKKSLQESAARSSSFSLKVHGLAAFPKILWARVEDSEELRSLQENLAQHLGEKVLFEKRSFTPHLSLVRFRAEKDLRSVIASFEGHVFRRLQIEEISLFESRPGDDFPMYLELASFSLNSRRLES